MTYGIRALCKLPSHPLLFPLKFLNLVYFSPLKSGIFFAEIQKNKNMLPSVLQMPTAVCFYFLNFCKKYTTFEEKNYTTYFC